MFVTTRERVAELHEQGLNGRQIGRALGLSKATVAYHLRRLGEPVDERCNRRYDWLEVQRFYDAGHSITECQQEFGFARASFMAAARRGDVATRPHATPLPELLSTTRNRQNLKQRLLAAGLKHPRCELCGIDAWRGRPLSLALHHVNGEKHDNRLENLQLLCPNCHSQTDNFSGRNRRPRGEREEAADDLCRRLDDRSTGERS